MTFLEFAIHMSPYWLMGAFVGYSIWNSSYRDMLAVNKRSVVKFTLFMLAMSVYRVWRLKSQMSHGMDMSGLAPVTRLPIAGTLFVGWEDLCFSLPLVFTRRLIGTSKWVMPIHYLLTIATMTSFMSGHLYQGILSACLISLYIPFAVKFGREKGFGTLVINHILYDLLTLSAVKIALG
jgi:hypothetical protein